MPPPFLTQGDGSLPQTTGRHDGTSQGSRDHDIPCPRGEYATTRRCVVAFFAYLLYTLQLGQANTINCFKGLKLAQFLWEKLLLKYEHCILQYFCTIMYISLPL